MARPKKAVEPADTMLDGPVKELIPQSPVDMDERIRQYVWVRDQLKEAEEAHHKKIAPLLEVKSLLSGVIMSFLTTSKQEAARTKWGTVFLSSKTTAALEDADAFMTFVVDNRLFELLERRASPTASVDYTETHGQPPPGVKLTTVMTINVRRAPGT